MGDSDRQPTPRPTPVHGGGLERSPTRARCAPRTSSIRARAALRRARRRHHRHRAGARRGPSAPRRPGSPRSSSRRAPCSPRCSRLYVGSLDEIPSRSRAHAGHLAPSPRRPPPWRLAQVDGVSRSLRISTPPASTPPSSPCASPRRSSRRHHPGGLDPSRCSSAVVTAEVSAAVTARIEPCIGGRGRPSPGRDGPGVVGVEQIVHARREPEGARPRCTWPPPGPRRRPSRRSGARGSCRGKARGSPSGRSSATAPARARPQGPLGSEVGDHDPRASDDEQPPQHRHVSIVTRRRSRRGCPGPTQNSRSGPPSDGRTPPMTGVMPEGTEVGAHTAGGAKDAAPDEPKARSSGRRRRTDLRPGYARASGGRLPRSRSRTATVRPASQGQNFDVIVSDIAMPDMDGLALLRAIRESDLDVPMVFMTGSPAVENAVQAIEYGAFRYLIKPVAPAAAQPNVVEPLAAIHQLGARVRRRGLSRSMPPFDARNHRRPRRPRTRYASALDQLSRSAGATRRHLEQPARSSSPGRCCADRHRPLLASPLDFFDAAERSWSPRLSQALSYTQEVAKVIKNTNVRVFVEPAPVRPRGRRGSTPTTAPSHRPTPNEIVLENHRARRARPHPRATAVRQRIARPRLPPSPSTTSVPAAPNLTSWRSSSRKWSRSTCRLVHSIDRVRQIKQKLVRSIIALCTETRHPPHRQGTQTPAERDMIDAPRRRSLPGVPLRASRPRVPHARVLSPRRPRVRPARVEDREHEQRHERRRHERAPLVQHGALREAHEGV